MPMLLLRSTLVLATVFWLAGMSANAAEITCEVTSPASRGQPVTVTSTLTGRVPGDSVHHYMLWLENQDIPDAVRLEGPMRILSGDDNRDGVFGIDISGWRDGVYTLFLRAYYFAAPGRPPERLDTMTRLTVKGGPPPPVLRIEPSATTLVAGQPLQLKFVVEGNPRAMPEQATLITRGQQVSTDREIPLDRTEQIIARWPEAGPATGDGGGGNGEGSARSGTLEIDTTGWRHQRLNTLVVSGSWRAKANLPPASFTIEVPAITVTGPGGVLPPREMVSWRGNRILRLIAPDVAGSMNTFTYPTNASWRKGGGEVFFESDRPGPSGAVVAPGERQLLMADIQTGALTHLATLQREDTEKYGRGHVPASSEYHFDYSAEADLLVYHDMAGHNLFTLKPGRQAVPVWHMAEGRIGDPPAISRDGTRVVFYALFNGPGPDSVFEGKTTGVFTLEIDPETGYAKGVPRLVHAYPWRVVSGSDARGRPRSIGVNHVQFNPHDNTKIMYAHEGMFQRTGEPEHFRIWHMNADGTHHRAIGRACEREPDFYTHEVYGPLGRFIYTAWGSSLVRIDVETDEVDVLFKHRPPFLVAHVGVSPDERWLVADIARGLGQDNDGNAVGGLFLIEVATRKSFFLAACPSGARHPRHLHPDFSPDGRRVGFTLADGRRGSQIAWVDISDLAGGNE
ncbi:MAG: oligogalacturonate lyase family protein [Opitutaceae bacterium]|jgi:hypothetical protein|nr:oligogalacturonate lyase family protein [Opitutaceae bacterium]